MNKQEAEELQEIIERRFPHEQLELMSLGGGQYAVKFGGGTAHVRAVWDMDDWQEYIGVKPGVVRKPEEEEEEVL